MGEILEDIEPLQNTMIIKTLRYSDRTLVNYFQTAKMIHFELL